jgi:hypothetical protein
MLSMLLVVGSVMSAQSPVVFDGGLMAQYGLVVTPDGTLPLPGIGLSLSAGPRLTRDVSLVGMLGGELFFAPDGITVGDGALLVGVQLGGRGHANLGVGVGYSVLADATGSLGQFSFAAAVTAVAPIMNSPFGFHFRLAFSAMPGGMFMLSVGIGLGGSVT